MCINKKKFRHFPNNDYQLLEYPNVCITTNLNKISKSYLEFTINIFPLKKKKRKRVYDYQVLE